ncbi:MAG: radical SAM/SPASM domain-containing protein [Candidatus Wukongarchaeota archaeon]|nr:SPASM domain-containing protein [Candidatus Wukongarchaeota archaeon]
MFLKFKFLTSVNVELTNDCNMNCEWCFAKKRKVGYMDFDLFRSVINQIPKFCRVCLSFGGESGLHPDFDEMVEYARKRGFRELLLYSNGTLTYKNIKVICLPKPPPKIIIDENFKIIENKANLKPSYNYCKSLFRTCVILWNGDVTLCCHDLKGKRVIGNIKNNSLKDIWNCDKYKKLRKKGFCDNCEVFRYKGS